MQSNVGESTGSVTCERAAASLGSAILIRALYGAAARALRRGSVGPADGWDSAGQCFNSSVVLPRACFYEVFCKNYYHIGLGHKLTPRNVLLLKDRLPPSAEKFLIIFPLSSSPI